MTGMLATLLAVARRGARQITFDDNPYCAAHSALERELSPRLSLGFDPDIASDTNAPIPDQGTGFLSDEIPYLPGPLPEEEPILPEEDEREWLFSDELDGDGDQSGSDESEEKDDE